MKPEEQRSDTPIVTETSLEESGFELDEIYIVHHNHLDVGFSFDQPVVWDLHRRYIDIALEAAEGSDPNDPAAFKWTVEATAPLLHWLQTASDEQVERLQRLEREGLIEVTGLLAGMTPLFGPSQTVESLRPVKHLRDEYGFDVTTAMNCCVNGLNWPMVETLLEAGIDEIIMAIDAIFGGSPLERPKAFAWEGASGRTIPAWNGYLHTTGHEVGIGTDEDAFRTRWLPRIFDRLEEIDYALPILLLQWGGFNTPAYGSLPDFVRSWNERDDVVNGPAPTLRIATPSEWWDAVRDHADVLPVHRGDWTDYWNFGCASGAREQAVNRETRRRLETSDAVESVLGALCAGEDERSPMDRSAPGERDRAWWGVNFFDEHTWSATVSVTDPENEDTYSQWYQKAGYAYEARSRSLMLQRDAVAELARRVGPGGDSDGDGELDLLVLNPLPWSREVAGPVPKSVVQRRPASTPGDELSARHHQDRSLGVDDFTLPPTTVPAFGYTVVSREELVDTRDRSFDDHAVVETERYELTFDTERGGISEWYDKRFDCQWVDQSSDHTVAGFVHEAMREPDREDPRDAFYDLSVHEDTLKPPSGWNSDWGADRTRPTDVLHHQVYSTPSGTSVEQRLSVPTMEHDIDLRFRIPESDSEIVVEANWTMGTETDPEATYLAFPFDVEDPVPRVDVGGQAMQPGRDQLSGACTDHFTAQNWVDVSNDRRGVTVGCPINPMVQFGGFHFGEDRPTFEMDEGLVLGWVTNNYWQFNYRASQPGRVRARYHLSPHAEFDEARAHRVGMESTHWPPVVHADRERPVEDASLPTEARLLDLPTPPILTLHVRSDDVLDRSPYPGAVESNAGRSDADGTPGGTLLVLLRNASESARHATVGGDVLTIDAAAETDLTGETEEVIDVEDGEVTVEIGAKETTQLLLRCRR